MPTDEIKKDTDDDSHADSRWLELVDQLERQGCVDMALEKVEELVVLSRKAQQERKHLLRENVNLGLENERLEKKVVAARAFIRSTTTGVMEAEAEQGPVAGARQKEPQPTTPAAASQDRQRPVDRKAGQQAEKIKALEKELKKVREKLELKTLQLKEKTAQVERRTADFVRQSKLDQGDGVLKESLKTGRQEVKQRAGELTAINADLKKGQALKDRQLEKGLAATQEDQAPDRREREVGKPGVGELRKALAASQKETAAAQKAMEASQKTLRNVKRSLEKTAKKLKKTERDKELVMEAMENYKKHDLERDQDKGREHEAW